MSGEMEKQLPVIKVKVGDQIYVGKHDAERCVVILEDGRIVRVRNPQPKKEKTTTSNNETLNLNNQGNNSATNNNNNLSIQKPAPGIQRPQTALEKMEIKKKEMAEREAQKKEELAQKSLNVSNDKKGEANRRRQEAVESKNIHKIEKTNQKRLEKEKKLAEKIARREAKQNAKISGDAGNYNSGKTQAKKVMLAFVYILVIAALMFGAKAFLDGQQEEVTVIRLKKDMLAGEVIRESDIEPYKMLKKSYDELGKVSYTSVDGSTSVRQIIYLWENKNDAIGKYIAIYTQGGQYLTLKNVTDKKIIRNPWLAEVGPTHEIYTLPISTEGINTRLLLPGSHLRVRVVVQPKDNTYSTPNNSLFSNNANTTAPVTGENEFDVNAILEVGGTVPIVSVVFDDLTCVDMLNAKGESIFDIYMALSKLPIEERAKYLETTIQGDSNAFQQKVIPTSLVLILTKSQATAMAQFENMSGAIIKYTILPYKDEDGTLLSSFTEIADQMSDIIQQYQQNIEVSQ